jgi:hypothetical protein
VHDIMGPMGIRLRRDLLSSSVMDEGWRVNICGV